MARIGSSGTGGASGSIGLNQIQLIVGGDSTGSGTTVGAYSTIQAALNAIPSGFDTISVRKVYTVLIPPGTYDEDLTVNLTDCHIELTALGAVNIGLFNNTFWAASNTRNITINCSATSIDSIRSTFGMGTYVPYGTAQTTHPAYSTSFRLSGSVIMGTVPAGFSNIEMYIDADVFGDVDTSVTATHNFHLYFNRSKIRGQVKGTRNLIQLADWCFFAGLVTGQTYSTLRNSVFSGGMTITSASGGGVNPSGMFGCDFSGVFTGPASSMRLDSTSNYFFVVNGASLAGGATQVILENGAGGGISQLTGDVTAGPGSGSQVDTIVKIQGTTVSGTTGTGNVVFSASPTLSGTAIIPNITGNTATASGPGGSVTHSGAAGGSTGAGGAGGNVTLSGGQANGDNTASNQGGNIALTPGNSKGSVSGGAITGVAGTGGPGTATAGAVGGVIQFVGGAGGVGSATSGNGGALTFTGGTAGAGTVPGNGGTSTLTGGAAAAVAGSAGGQTTVSGASGTSTGSGGAGGAVNITAGSAQGDNTVSRVGGAVTITAGASKGDSAGGSFTINLGSGGAGTGSVGATGGTNNINAGTGGIGSATSGSGGNSTINAGTGGAGTAGGNGGTATLHGGTGGTGSASGGNGGPANVTGGSAASFANSSGGSVSLAAAGGSSTGAGGAGGTATITGGAAGGDNTQSNNGGSVTVTAGNSKGSSSGAAVNINGGVGGIGTSTTGALGGAINVTAGSGGVGSATGGGGAALNLNAGAAGNIGTANGGDTTISAGAGTAAGVGGSIIFKTAAANSLTEHVRIKSNGDTDHTSGNVRFVTIGNGIQVKTGTNSRIGQTALVAGTSTVGNTSVTANTRIFITVSAAAGTQGFLRTTKVVNTSFTVASTSATETSTVDWFLVESVP